MYIQLKITILRQSSAGSALLKAKKHLHNHAKETKQQRNNTIQKRISQRLVQEEANRCAESPGGMLFGCSVGFQGFLWLWCWARLIQWNCL